MRNKVLHFHKAHSGFTLVEIMVALAISALLLSGITQVFFTLKQTNKASTALSRIRESGQVAYDVMAYDGRLAGFLGCANPVIKNTSVVVANNPPIYGGSYLTSSIWGADVTATGWGVATGLYNGSINGSGARNARLYSDVVRFQHLSTAKMALTAAVTNPANNVPVGTNTLGLVLNSVAVVADCSNATMFRVTSVGATPPIDLGHGSTLNSSSNLGTTFNVNASVYKLISNTYFVANTGRTNSQGDPIFALYLRDIYNNVNELVEGVDYMRVLYGQTLGNGNVRYVSASDSTLNMDEVKSIKIALLLVSDEPVLDSDDTHRYMLLDIPIANSGTLITYPNDHRMRRVFNMTLQLQNRGNPT